MSSRLRRILVVLLMLALPWQGVAAASMRLCEAMHGTGAADAVDLHAAHRPSVVPEGSATPGEPAHHCHEAADSTAVVLGDSPDTDSTVGSCSACAVCCLTAATAAGALDVGHPRLGTVNAGEVAAPEPARLPERLERPPRVA